MATLIAVLMKGLQTSRANLKRDTYQAELKKRVANIGAKAEAYVFENGSIGGFAATGDDLTDPVGEKYEVTPVGPTKTGTYTVTVAPHSSGILEGLGVTAEKYEFQ
jgi:hypothetical protein